MLVVEDQAKEAIAVEVANLADLDQGGEVIDFPPSSDLALSPHI